MAEIDQRARRETLAATRTQGAALTLASAWLRAALASPIASLVAPVGDVGDTGRAMDAETPDLDAQVLLAHVVGAARFTLLAYPERPLTPEQAATYAGLVARRAAREPVAYLTGRREFMGLGLLVDHRALIPRPETELLVEAALADLRRRLDAGNAANAANAAANIPSTPQPATPQASFTPPSHPDGKGAGGVGPLVADIGTGSGAIALAVAVLEARLARIYATDISADALALAAANGERLGVADRVIFLQGDLLAPLPETVDVLLANLPYVAPRDAATLPTDVSHYEPGLALYGADDGLGHLRRLFAQAPAHLRPHATLFLEFGYDQRAAVESLVRATFPQAMTRVVADYAGWDRFIEIRL